jgi:hypothetical protein
MIITITNQFNTFTVMKKIILFSLAIWAMTQLTQATTYYVSSAGSDTNNGTSWASPYKTIGKALTIAASPAPTSLAPNSIWVKAGSYDGSYNPPAAYINLYGGFAGTESLLSDRITSDKDGNGVVEPWEFTSETMLTYTNTLTTNAAPLFYIDGTKITSADKLIIDGFTMTYTNITNSTNASSVLNYASNALATFQNNIVRNCNVNISSANYFSILLAAKGIVKNSLFEKNSATIVFASTANNLAVPMISLSASTKMTGCIVRNNNLTVDYTGNTYGSSNFKGLILQINGGTNGTPAQYTTVSNCIIHNNEATYLPSSSRFNSASMVGFATFSSSATTDSLLNCVIANNKGTRLVSGGAGLVLTYAATTNTAYHYVQNNVFWNNIDETSAVKNLVIPTAQGAGSVSYNVMNGGMTYSTSLATVTSNHTDLSSTNGGTKYPSFNSPTTTIGNTTDLSSEKSDWRILTDSYLIGKGITTTQLTDKVGNAYLASPSVGAYETENTLATGVNPSEIAGNSILLTKNGFISQVQATALVFTFSGARVKNEMVNAGQEVTLPSGAYILRLKSNTGVLVQKIVL